MPVVLEAGVYTLIEDKLKDVMSADAQLAVGAVTFESGPRGNSADYGENELPAVVSAVGRGYSEDELTTGGVFECRFPFSVAAVVSGVDWRTRHRLAKDLGARVEIVLRKQWGGNQVAALDTLIPGAVLGSILIAIKGTVVLDDSDLEGPNTIFRAVSITEGTLRVDIRTEVP